MFIVMSSWFFTLASGTPSILELDWNSSRISHYWQESWRLWGLGLIEPDPSLTLKCHRWVDTGVGRDVGLIGNWFGQSQPLGSPTSGEGRSQSFSTNVVEYLSHAYCEEWDYLFYEDWGPVLLLHWPARGNENSSKTNTGCCLLCRALKFKHTQFPLLGPWWSEWPVLPPRAMVPSRPRLLQKTMPESLVLLKLGSVLMTVAPVTTEGCVDAWGLGHMILGCQLVYSSPGKTISLTLRIP